MACFFAAHAATSIDLGMPGGLFGCCFGGEGLVMKFTGPMEVYSQNRDPYPWDRLFNAQKKRDGQQQQGGGVSVNVSV